MTRRASNVAPFRPPSDAEAEGRAALRFIGQLFKAIAESRGDQKRILGWCRVSDLTPPRGPLSKGTVYRYIKSGKLRAVRLDGITLIEVASVNELLGRAEPWALPKKKKTNEAGEPLEPMAQA